MTSIMTFIIHIPQTINQYTCNSHKQFFEEMFSKNLKMLWKMLIKSRKYSKPQEKFNF